MSKHKLSHIPLKTLVLAIFVHGIDPEDEAQVREYEEALKDCGIEGCIRDPGEGLRSISAFGIAWFDTSVVLPSEDEDSGYYRHELFIRGDEMVLSRAFVPSYCDDECDARLESLEVIQDVSTLRETLQKRIDDYRQECNAYLARRQGNFEKMYALIEKQSASPADA